MTIFENITWMERESESFSPVDIRMKDICRIKLGIFMSELPV